MKLPVKVIAMILLLGVLASGMLFAQCSTSSPKAVKLTARDMQLIFQELLPPQQQQEINSDPEGKKQLVDNIKKLLAVAQAAEQEGYAEHADIKSQLSFQLDRVMNEAYKKKNPDAKATDDEINAYYSSHPKEFDEFLASNPRASQQAQGPQREEMRKQVGDFKVIAERARREGLERDDLTRLQLLFARSQTLAGAYLGELQKNADKLVADGDVEQYFKEHPSDFDEVRVRHILISTQPKPEAEDENDKDGKDAKDKKTPEPKALTKEEARKKSEGLLARARKGEDFAKLASENSDDPGSKDKGGEYDFFAHGKMVPEFEKAAFALKPGEISDLVETQFGFHIIKLEERRSAASPETDQKVRQQIVEKLKQDKIEEKINQITRDSTVVVPEDFDTTPKVAAQPQTSSVSPSGVLGPEENLAA
jgi:peptidyl-prolyl cis-trans isomerase C